MCNSTRSLAEITPEFGTFDYIICHGVYSWVPDDARSALLRVCSGNLAEDGVAFVSYNVFPGWHIPGMIREMMIYHVRRIQDPATKAKAARGFLDFLGNSAPDKDGHYARILRDEAVQLRAHADSYLLHEHLEDVNEPIYYHEFVDRVAGHGLKVLGDAHFHSMAISAQPRFVEALDRVATNPVDREQYFDFLCNRRFRRSMLCHADARTALRADLEVVKTLTATSLVRPATLPVDMSPRTHVNFRAADGSTRISAPDPLTKAALMAMIDAEPRALSFDELSNAIRRRVDVTRLDASDSLDHLAERLLQCYAGNAIELHSYDPPIESSPGERPRAFPVARISAANGPLNMPNLWHAFANLSEFDSLVLRQLDGKKNRAGDRRIASFGGLRGQVHHPAKWPAGHRSRGDPPAHGAFAPAQPGTIGRGGPPDEMRPRRHLTVFFPGAPTQPPRNAP